MVISVLNKKGGVGKTPIAFSLAKDLDLFLISNDDSVIEDIYPGRAKIMEKPKVLKDTVYDFGGFVDSGVLEIIEKSDLVIVPTFNEIDALKRTIKTIAEIKDRAKKIIVVATRTEGKGDFKNVKDTIEQFFKGTEVFELKKSKIFANAIASGWSVRELRDENPLTRRAYRNIGKQYEKLLEFIEKLRKGKQ